MTTAWPLVDPISTSPEPVDTDSALSAWETSTSPEPLLTRSSAPARSSTMSPDPVSMISGPSKVSSRQSPEPLRIWPAPMTPSNPMSALPVLTTALEWVGRLIVTTYDVSPPKRPRLPLGATTLICLPSWRTMTSSASRPTTSTVVAVVSVAVTFRLPLPSST